ncbi:MAG: hypothetical protein ACOYMF_13750 [Bacteroidales bacterium]
MKQSLQLNVIPFSAPFQEAEFAFYPEQMDGHIPVFKDDLKGLLKDHFTPAQLLDLNKLYTDFQEPREDALVLKINLVETPRFASHYYRYLIRQYFQGVADIMHQNYTSETEVWFLDPEIKNDKFSVYNQFTLKVQHGRVTDMPELVVSYDGTTKVLKKPVSKIYNFRTELFNWIACNGILYKWKYRPQEVINQPENCFPVVSNILKPHFEIAFDVPVLKNRYPNYYSILQSFYSKYLDTDTFRNIIPLSKNGFYISAEDQYRVISPTSNDLLYTPPKTGKEPKKDFKYKGPYQLPQKPSNFKFFFIYQASDKSGAVKELYKYFHVGFKDEKYPFPRMQDYIKVPFELDISKNIEFDKVENAVSTIRNAVKNADWLPDTQYMALFVNPVPKLEKDENKNGIYYKIKEILLYESVLSQVIKSEHLWKYGKPNNYFNTFLPHIEIAILAKLGGIPWKLNRPPVSELIVGVGAFYSIKHKTRFVGSAFCFNNEGIFKGFECFRSNDTTSLAGSIREAVGKFIVANHTVKRLVIHFYKDISKKELQPIIQTLHALGLPIPVIVVTINKTESKELLGMLLQYFFISLIIAPGSAPISHRSCSIYGKNEKISLSEPSIAITTHSSIVFIFYLFETTNISKSFVVNLSSREKAPGFAPKISILVNPSVFNNHVISLGI